jgi:hypothetical protein
MGKGRSMKNRAHKTENGGKRTPEQRTEYGGHKTEDGARNTEDEWQRTEDRRPRAH